MRKRYNLDHLPRSKRVQLQSIVRLLRSSIQPEQIILYGSHAHGDWVEDTKGGYVSDFDIFIIVQDPVQSADHARWSDLQESARALVPRTLVSIDVFDIGEVHRQLEKGSDFIQEIVDDGIVLYDSGRYSEITDTSQLGKQRAHEYAAARSRWLLESADVWLRKFHEDLQAGDMNHAAFNLHQAAEMYLKTALQALTGVHRKGHDLHALVSQCGRSDARFKQALPRRNAEEKRRLRLLDQAYQGARYDMYYTMNREDLEIIETHVQNLRKLVAQVCREVNQ